MLKLYTALYERRTVRRSNLSGIFHCPNQDCHTQATATSTRANCVDTN